MARIGSFEVDALISITPSRPVEATQHPVESGADISDHAIQRPLTLDVEAVVSDTPIGSIASRREQGRVPSVDAQLYLDELLSTHELITVTSDVYAPFKNMMLLNWSAPKSSQTGTSLRFRASFQQIRLADVDVSNEVTLVTLPGSTRAKKKQVKTEKPAESKPFDAEAFKNEVLATDPEPSKSILTKVFR